MCPYCKLNPCQSSKSVICINCRNYADATAVKKREAEEQALFALYKWVPVNWTDWDEWRTDPYFLISTTN